MNPDVDLDRTLRDWFEEGPNELPDYVLDRTAVQLDDISQRGLSWLPWHGGTDLMNRLMLPLAGVAAALLLAVGVYAAVNGGLRVGGPPEPDGVPYTSDRHHYSLVLPDDSWYVVEIPGEWAPGEGFSESGPGVDSVRQTGATEELYILFNTQEVPAGTTTAQWEADYDAANERWFPQCQLPGTEPIGMDGVSARLATYSCDPGGNAMEVTALRNGRAYALRIFGPVEPDWDPRPLIDEWLTRFSFSD